MKLLKGKRLEPVSARHEFRWLVCVAACFDESIISAVGCVSDVGCRCTFVASESASVRGAGDGCQGGSYPGSVYPGIVYGVAD